MFPLKLTIGLRSYEGLQAPGHPIRFLALDKHRSRALSGSGVEEGLCVVADEQTAGRGRLQRTWLSRKAPAFIAAPARPIIL